MAATGVAEATTGRTGVRTATIARVGNIVSTARTATIGAADTGDRTPATNAVRTGASTGRGAIALPTVLRVTAASTGNTARNAMRGARGRVPAVLPGWK
jgi:hypothetical protein